MNEWKVTKDGGRYSYHQDLYALPPFLTGYMGYTGYLRIYHRNNNPCYSPYPGIILLLCSDPIFFTFFSKK